MSAEYDKIAEQYKSALGIKTRHLSDYNFQMHVGDVTGQSVLDLACGSGDFTRKFKHKGAARVLGIDISSEMIKLARQDEAQDPLGIEYQINNVSEMGKVGEFDLVAASFLLHYATTKAELLQMCQTVYDNLKPGHRFVTLNTNIRMKPEDYDQAKAYEKYGAFPCLPGGVLQEGAVIRWTILMPGQNIQFDNYYFHQETYEWALTTAGFKTINWYDLILPDSFVGEEGEEFWQYLLDHPFHGVIECQK
jgi:toxoflavin synthase